MQIAAADGQPLAEWRYDDIVELAAPDNVLRLGRRGGALLERLEVFDAPFAALLDERAGYVDRTGALQRRERLKVVGWSLAATASLLAVAYFGMPAIAARLTPLVPAAIERKLGEAVDMQVRGQLDTHHAGAGFECGNAGGELPGRAALDKLVQRLESTAALATPLAGQGRAPQRGQRHRAAGRTHLCVPRPDRQGRQCRRGRRRDRA